MEVGIRQLKERASEVVRRVRESREVVTITYRGRAVARIVPLEDADHGGGPDVSAIWSEMDQLAREIGDHWPADVSAVEAVKEQRREL